MQGYVRLDPAGGLILRAYAELVNITAPLSTMTKDFTAVAHVAIAGNTAEVTGLKGGVTWVAYRDFERQMRARGVSRVYWERHRADGSIKLVMRELT